MMNVNGIERLTALDAILYTRPAGRNIIDFAIEEIERLRKKANIDNNLLYAETEKVYLAEKEIERLCSRLKLSIDYADGIPAGYGEDEIDRQQVEIERLRSGARCPHCDELRLELGEARNEIKQLHAEAKQKQADIVSLAHDLGKNEKFRQAIWIVNEQLEAEIKQLRELLREGITTPIRSRVVPHSQNWEKRVNEALGHE